MNLTKQALIKCCAEFKLEEIIKNAKKRIAQLNEHDEIAGMGIDARNKEILGLQEWIVCLEDELSEVQRIVGQSKE